MNVCITGSDLMRLSARYMGTRPERGNRGAKIGKGFEHEGNAKTKHFFTYFVKLGWITA